MERVLSRFGGIFYAAMRVVLALIYMAHGLQKVFGLFGGHAMPLHSLLGVAGVLELVLGALIALGLFTSWAAFIASGEMAVAYFRAHAPLGQWPIENHGELAVVLCFAFLYIASQGAGRLSVDAARR
jgi:putative oxidoreductase